MKVEFDITDVGALIESPVGMMHVSKVADIMGIDEDLLRSMCSAAIIPAVRRENDQNNLFINCRQLNRHVRCGCRHYPLASKGQA
ncbi:hypothetical protein AT251_24400 [Enterovibrio nigricans]|nr:hypothetical protein [Enterovibrio nigricans]PKF48670.1 hypothetical protein AT251_24400 [Enterovibrio nigricans]